jgi:hypothetical protein
VADGERIVDEDGEDGDGDGDVAPLDGIRTWNTAAGRTEDGWVIFGEASRSLPADGRLQIDT